MHLQSNTAYVGVLAIGSMARRGLAAAFAIAGAGITTPMLAQRASADSAAACRSAIQIRGASPDTRHTMLAFDQPAALLCTALPATADTLDILAALAERGGDRALVGHYALIVANEHLRASRSSGERRDIERALASLRVAYGIDSSRTTGFLVGATATALALLLQESGVCADAARALPLLAEARSVFPADSDAHAPPDWASLERKARENEKRACRRQGARSADADPPPD